LLTNHQELTASEYCIVHQHMPRSNRLDSHKWQRWDIAFLMVVVPQVQSLPARYDHSNQSVNSLHTLGSSGMDTYRWQVPYEQLSVGVATQEILVIEKKRRSCERGQRTARYTERAQSLYSSMSQSRGVQPLLETMCRVPCAYTSPRSCGLQQSRKWWSSSHPRRVALSGSVPVNGRLLCQSLAIARSHGMLQARNLMCCKWSLESLCGLVEYRRRSCRYRDSGFGL